MAFQQFRSDVNNDIVQPNWMAEPLFPHTLIPGGAKVVSTAFSREDQVTVTLAAGAVTAGSNKTLTAATALSGDIPVGTILDFGSGEFATLNNGATKGATSITGVTLAADLEGAETATYLGVGKRRIASGTLLGRTYTERDAGTGFGPYASADDEVYLVAFQVEDAAIDSDVTLVRPQVLVKENWLPGFASYTTDAKAALRSKYQVVRG